MSLFFFWNELVTPTSLYRLSKLYRFLQTCVFLLVKLKISDIVYSTSLFISSLALLRPTTTLPPPSNESVSSVLVLWQQFTHRASVSHFSLCILGGGALLQKRNSGIGWISIEITHLHLQLWWQAVFRLYTTSNEDVIITKRREFHPKSVDNILFLKDKKI